MAYTKGYRFKNTPGDNHAAIISRHRWNPAYAAVIALINLFEEHHLVDVGQLTGALSMTAEVDNPFTGDEMTIIFAADGTNRVVTFSTGFVSAGTVTCLASKSATVKFVFSGAVQKWVEVTRFVQA